MAIAAVMATIVRFNEDWMDICFLPFLRAADFAARRATLFKDRANPGKLPFLLGS